MSKKKFKDTKVGQFLLEKIPSVVGSLAGDTPLGNVVKTLIGGSDMSDADKEIALKKLEQESIQQKPQLDLFATTSDAPEESLQTHPVITMLDEISPDELSPRQALDKLYQLKKMVV